MLHLKLIKSISCAKSQALPNGIPVDTSICHNRISIANIKIIVTNIDAIRSSKGIARTKNMFHSRVSNWEFWRTFNRLHGMM